MYNETVSRYADLAKAAGDLKRAVTMIEAWTAKAEDARKRLLALEGGEPTTTEASVEAPIEPAPESQ